VEIQKFVDALRGGAFDSLHDLGDCDRQLGTSEWHQDKVHMIRHDDQTIEVKHQTIPSHASIDNNRSCSRRQSPALVGAKSDEKDFEVRLKMGQAAVFIGVHKQRISSKYGEFSRNNVTANL
jgi:hypothetical protein